MYRGCFTCELVTSSLEMNQGRWNAVIQASAISSTKDPWIGVPKIYSTYRNNSTYGNEEFESSAGTHYTYPRHIESIDNSNLIYKQRAVEFSDNIKSFKIGKSKKLFQLAFNEFLGTAIIIYIGCFGCSASAFGFGTLISVQIFSQTSGGHYNPAVTLAAFITNNLDLREIPLYISSQFLGSLAGYGFLYISIIVQSHKEHCTSTISRINILCGFILELVITTIFVLLICSLWDKKSNTRDEAAAIKIGLAVLGLITVSIEYTGGSMNTVRSFAPALFTGYWDEGHWVYWVAPNLGGIIGGFLYRFLLMTHS